MGPPKNITFVFGGSPVHISPNVCYENPETSIICHLGYTYKMIYTDQ